MPATAQVVEDWLVTKEIFPYPPEFSPTEYSDCGMTDIGQVFCKARIASFADAMFPPLLPGVRRYGIELGCGVD